MAPIVYPSAIAFKQTGSGPLPGYKKTPVLNWADLNSLLVTAKDAIESAYLVYLQANIDGRPDIKDEAVASMNATLSSLAQAVVTLGYFGEVRFYLENNNSVIRAASNPDDVGNKEDGRTEIIVAQQQIDTIANAVRTSSTTTKFTWYGAIAMGSFNPVSEYPAHILKIAANP